MPIDRRNFLTGTALALMGLRPATAQAGQATAVDQPLPRGQVLDRRLIATTSFRRLDALLPHQFCGLDRRPRAKLEFR
jgi:hypothetical protein